MNNSALIVIFFLFLVSPLHANEAPFGLKWGMTKEQVRDLGVIFEPIKDADSNFVETNSLPKNPEASDYYILFFHEMLGLASVNMVSTRINDVSKINDKFDEINSSLTKKYGPAIFSHNESDLDRLTIYEFSDLTIMLHLWAPVIILSYDSPEGKSVREKSAFVKYDDLLLDINNKKYGDYVVTKSSIQFVNENMVFLKNDLFSLAFVLVGTSKLSREDRKYLLTNCQIKLCSGTFYGRIGNVMIEKKGLILEKIEWSDSETESKKRESKTQNVKKYSVEVNTSVEDNLDKNKSETMNQESNEDSIPAQSNFAFSGYIYFAAEKPPVGKDSPPESPLCYRFKVASIEEQLSKLQNKYGSKFHGEITSESNGHKTLIGTRNDENNNIISYEYYTNPDACNTYQSIRNYTLPEELKSQDMQAEVINASGIEEYIQENYAEYKNDLIIESMDGVNNAKIYLIYFNHNDYCGSAGCNLIIASAVGNKLYILWNDNVYNYEALSNIAIRLELHSSYCKQPDAQSCEYTFRILNNNKLELKSVRGIPQS